MPKTEFTIEAISPWFLNGAEPRGAPEWRSASVRGQLRYWLRAIVGAESTDLSKLWERESRVFGSTGRGSAVSVRMFGKAIKPVDSLMLPHRTDRRSPGQSVRAGTRAVLELVTRPGVQLPTDALNALRVWSLLGGIGKRSRRMFGSLDVRSGNPAEQGWYTSPATPQAWAETIGNQLSAIVTHRGTPAKPPFPTLHPAHSWVIVGTEIFDSAQDANIALFRDLLRTAHFRAKEQTFGQAVGGRRSSPLIAQVRRVNGGVIPVLTALRSTPDRHIDWAHLRDLMNAAQSRFAGSTVWGGWS